MLELAAAAAAVVEIEAGGVCAMERECQLPP